MQKKQCSQHSEAPKKAEKTRDRILQAAFEEMHKNGYQGLRVDAVLKKTGLAKGALYHHFPNKKSLGYAVVDEILYARLDNQAKQLECAEDTLNCFCEILRSFVHATTDEQVLLGCPVNNLSQEMANLDKGFKERLCRIYETKAKAINDLLTRGQQQGYVRNDINPQVVAGFVVSAFQGIIGGAKCMGSRALLIDATEELCRYMQSLRT